MVKEINREGYRFHSLVFRGYTTLSIEEKKLLLVWRNDKSIRKWMYNKDVISLENHLSFIEGLKSRYDAYYWVVYDNDGKPLGTCCVTSIDKKNSVAELGVDTVPKSEVNGFEVFRECFYFFFNILGFDYLYCAVDKDNKSAILLDSFFGCVFDQTKIVDKNGQPQEYLVSTNLSKGVFGNRYQLGFDDYVDFFINNK